MTRLLDPRNGPAHDTTREAGPVGPTAGRFVIAASPRTGSTLLARALWDLGLGAPKEILNPVAIRDWEVRLGSPAGRAWHRPLAGPLLVAAGAGWSDRHLRAHLDRVEARRSQGGWFGHKLHGHHLRRWFLDAGRDPTTWLAADVWIRIRRQDLQAQAVSWARARGTGAWTADRRGPALRAPRPGAVRRAHRRILTAEASWDTVLADMPVVEVTYEQMVSDWESTLMRVAHTLGARPVDLPRPALRRQSAGPDPGHPLRHPPAVGDPRG